MELCPPNSTPLSQEAYSQVQVGLGWELEIWVLTKWTTRSLSCLLVNIGKSYPGLLPGKEHAKKQTVLQEAAAAEAGDCGPLATTVPSLAQTQLLVLSHQSPLQATEGQCLSFLYSSSTHRVSGYKLCAYY